MFRLLRLVVGTAFFLLPLFIATSHSDSREDAGTRVTCGGICARFDTCVAGLDVLACTRACVGRARFDVQLADAVKTCGQCINDATCTEATVCWADCPVVPYAATLP